MRLSEFEHRSILSAFRQIFKNGNIYLFGSRVDDHKKGGDIDLYIETEQSNNLSEKKFSFYCSLNR